MLMALILLSITATTGDKAITEEAIAIGTSCLVELRACGAHKTDLRDEIYLRELEIGSLRAALADRPAPAPETPSMPGALAVVAIGGAVCGAIGGGLGAHFDGTRGALLGGGGGSLLCAGVAVVAAFMGR